MRIGNQSKAAAGAYESAAGPLEDVGGGVDERCRFAEGLGGGAGGEEVADHHSELIGQSQIVVEARHRAQGRGGRIRG